MQLVSLDSQTKDSIISSVISTGGYQRQAFWTSGQLFGSNWPANNNPANAAWVWANDEQVVYSNWCFGQPNNYGGNEENIVTYNGCWFDTPPQTNQYAICEEIDPVAGALVKQIAGSPLNRK
jgi:hypothetical protein